MGERTLARKTSSPRAIARRHPRPRDARQTRGLIEHVKRKRDDISTHGSGEIEPTAIWHPREKQTHHYFGTHRRSSLFARAVHPRRRSFRHGRQRDWLRAHRGGGPSRTASTTPARGTSFSPDLATGRVLFFPEIRRGRRPRLSPSPPSSPSPPPPALDLSPQTKARPPVVLDLRPDRPRGFRRRRDGVPRPDRRPRTRPR